MCSLQCQLFLIANLTRIIPCQRALEDWTLLNLLQTGLIVLLYAGLSANYLTAENNFLPSYITEKYNLYSDCNYLRNVTK